MNRKQKAEWCAHFFACVAALLPAAAQAKDVLLLHPLEQRAPEFAAIEAGLRREFANASVEATHVYSELVDLDFRGPIDRRIFADYLRAKYADVGIDAVVALSDDAVQFVSAYRDVIGNVPLVFTTRASSATSNIPNSSSVVAPLFPSRTVELALRLQPSAKHLFVVSDAPTADDVGLPPLRTFMPDYSGKLDVEYLLGLAPDALLDRVSHLPPSSLVLYAPIDRTPVPDGLAPHEMAEQLAARANAPVYGVHDDDVGRGFVGGYMPRSAQIGAELARQTLRALRGEASRAADIGASYIVDSRALSRFKLDEARLPAGTELKFAPPSIWKLYQGWIITLLVLVAVQFALIVTLLIQSISRRRDRLALAETAQRFQLARVAGKVGIWQWDRGTELLIVEPELRELLGYAASEGVEATRDWTKLIYEEDLPKFRRAARDHAQGVTPSFELQCRILDKNGHVRWFLCRGQALIGRVRLIGTATDITDRKRDEDERARTLLQLQEQRNELAHLGRAAMAGALSGAVAHELNQPLSAMMSNARAGLQFIAGGSADRQEIKDILADIENDGRRAGEVIRHLRSLLRRGEAQFETVQLDVIVDQVLRLINSDLISNNIKVVHEPMAGVPAISADPVQLQQVMLNLLSNACDALKGVNPRDRRITIGVGMRGPGRLRISVSDNGCGFADGNPEHLFKPFVTTKRSGLGLGLSISRSIIDAHGGRIWAENNRDAGATFHVDLALAAQGAERVVA
ncbi:MAG TPA: ATP-binding protein [Gammaproteobacteria bacterium]|nr:ATP-binding protein [Gammaproteobacteria bacterium]